MIPRHFTALVAATTALARTPEGFTPASNTDLIVEYSGFAPLNGAVVSRSVTTTQPRIGTRTRLTGSSYAILMIDLDIPTNSPPQTDTLLHWLQTGLVPSTTPIQLNTTSGAIQAFLLLNSTTSPTSPIVPYFGPNPPARIPLSHRYTQLLVDMSGMAEDGDGTRVLREAAATLRGFNAANVLDRAGLGGEGRVVAGNFYNVTNPGPASNATAADGNGNGNGAGGGGGMGTGTGTGVGGGGGATETGAVTTSAAGVRVEGRVKGGLMVSALGLVGVVALGL